MGCSCCAFGNTADQHFNAEKVAKELAQYRRKGPGPTTRGLREGLVSAGLREGTVLDIGGGLGILSLELLDAGFSRAVVVDASSAHDWPGNVRELQNLVERAVIVWQGGPIRFPIDGPPRLDAVAPVADTAVASPVLTRDELKRLERESIVRALEQTNGKVSGPGGAAELLGLRPTTLASRIAALGLKRAKAS